MEAMFSFLKDLKNNNNRTWFQGQGVAFDKAKDQANNLFKAFYASLALQEELEPLKIYRIYRDVRFSNDKTPYKSYFSAQTGRKKPYLRGGYYLHLEPGQSFVGAGFWGPVPADLLRIRKDIEASDELVSIVADPQLQQAFGTLQGEQLKTAPKGFDKQHERVELLRYKQFIFKKSYSDEEVLSADFSAIVTADLRLLEPFLAYMTNVLIVDGNGNPLY